MEPEAKYTLVGSAVLGLVVLVAAAIYWLATSGQGKEVHTYTIYFSHQSLEGLQVRSDVRMKGIRVGAVTAFSFSPTRPGTVQVVVAVDPATPVKQSTQAVVDRNLITGVAAIRLQNAREDSPPLPEASAGENQVIAEGASQLQQFSEMVDQLSQRADETMRRIDAALVAAERGGAQRDAGERARRIARRSGRRQAPATARSLRSAGRPIASTPPPPRRASMCTAWHNAMTPSAPTRPSASASSPAPSGR